jgi:hypothetical protein
MDSALGRWDRGTLAPGGAAVSPAVLASGTRPGWLPPHPATHPEGGVPGPGSRSDTYLVDSFDRARSVGDRMLTRTEALAQTVTDHAVELVVSGLDVNALLDRVDLNALLDKVDINQVLDRIDLDRLLARVDFNDIVQHIDFDALVEQTDLGAVIAAASSGAASDALDVVRSQAVGLDEFIAGWMGRLRRRPYSGPPGPPDGLRAKAGS